MSATPKAKFEDRLKAMPQSRRSLFLSMLVIGVGMVFIACGGSGATLEEYFGEISRITEESDRRIQELTDEFPGGFEDLEAAKEIYPAYVETYQEFVDGADALDPPDEAANAHDQFVAVSKELQELNKARLERLGEAQEASQLDEIFGADDEYEAAVERQNDACVALRGVAEARGIAVPGLANCEE